MLRWLLGLLVLLVGCYRSLVGWLDVVGWLGRWLLRWTVVGLCDYYYYYYYLANVDVTLPLVYVGWLVALVDCCVVGWFVCWFGFGLLHVVVGCCFVVAVGWVVRGSLVVWRLFVRRVGCGLVVACCWTVG